MYKEAFRIKNIIILLSILIFSFSCTLEVTTENSEENNGSTPLSISIKNISYTLANDSYEVVADENQASSIIAIKSSIYNTKVTRIEDNAFYGNSNIEIIAIPSSIKYIGKNAFYNCPNIKTVYIEADRESFLKIEGAKEFITMLDSSVVISFENKALDIENITDIKLAVGEDSINLEWINPDNIFHEYTHINYKSDTDIKYNCISSEENSFKIEKLTKGILYEITIYTENIFGNFSEEISLFASPNELDTETTNNIKLKLSSNGLYYIVTGYNGNDRNAYIPEKYEHIPITHITKNAFTNIDSLIFSTAIINIDAKAFNTELYNIYYTGTKEQFEEISGISYILEENPSTEIYYSNYGENGDSKGLYYRINPNKKEYTLVGYSGNQEELILEPYFKGLPVTSIASSALDNTAKTLRTLWIPESIKSIETNVFKNCQYLTNVYYEGTKSQIDIAKTGNKVLFLYIWYECIKHNDFILGKKTDKDYTIIKYTGTLKDINLQTVISDEYKTTAIASNAFRNSDIESIIIPNNIKTINGNAFANCSKIYRVWIQPNTNEISIAIDGNRRFLNFAEYNIDINNLELTEEGFILDKTTLLAFYSSLAKTDSIIIPEKVQKIAKAAFYKNDSIKTIHFTYTGENFYISDYAFYKCTALQTIDFTRKTKNLYIGAFSFASCTALKNSMQNGIADRGFMLNNSIVSLDNSSFENATSLEHIIIENTGWPLPYKALTSIPDKCFYGCSSLKDVKLGNQINFLMDNVFDNCTSLKSISHSSSLTFRDDTNRNIRNKLI